MPAPRVVLHVGQLSDESLLVGMATGNTEAAAAFVRRYQARVYGLALTVVGNPAAAEDVAQEVFVKAWRHATAYDARRGSVAAWLLTIARNAAIDAIRYRRETAIDHDLLLAILPDNAGHADRSTNDVDTSEQLRAALRHLPVQQSRPLLLMVFYGLTAKEIAAREGLPVGTVKTRVRRALSVLRQQRVVWDE